MRRTVTTKERKETDMETPLVTPFGSSLFQPALFVHVGAVPFTPHVPSYSVHLTYSVPLSCRSSPRLHRHPEGKVTRDGVCNERGTERSEKGGE